MNTIKFESWDGAYPLHKGTDREQPAQSTALQEGEKIWHRPFQVETLKEYEEWKKRFAWGARHTTCYVPGDDPALCLRQKEKGDTSIVHFEYLTFFDKKGELWKVIIFCCNVYIMNEAGQTVDKFSG